MRISTMRRLALAGLVSIVSLAASAANAQTLTVAMFTPTPFGAPPPGEGFCLDLMTAIAAKTGHQYDYLGVVAADVFTALTGNTADIACTSLGANNQRRSLGVAFTSAIFTNYEGIVVPATDAREYTALADFAGQPVGTITATVYVPLLQNAGFADARTYATTAEGFAALQRGDVRMFVTAAASFAYQQRVLGQWADLRLVETYVPTAIVYPGIAVRSADTALLGELQAALEALKADGTVATLVEKWQLPPPPF